MGLSALQDNYARLDTPKPKGLSSIIGIGTLLFQNFKFLKVKTAKILSFFEK